ncbi:hypothetical protein ACQ4PT_036159 [Festuca glaucescens]
MGGYVPPGYNALRTTLLDKEKKHTTRMLEPIKTTWPLKGVTICTDGWSDPQRRPILNFMAVTEGGPMFLKSIATKGEIKSTEYIFEKLREIIDEVGVENVVQVITDNAANCRSAGLMVEAKYNNIYWTPCIVHTLNLAVKDICDPKNFAGDNEVLWFIREIADEASFIKNYIMNHSMRLSMFNTHSKLKFLQIAETRFASILIMLKRFLDIKESLVLMVVHENWAAYKEVSRERAQRVKELILNDLWWDKLSYIISFMLPIYSMIRVADTDKPCLHLIYELWDDMIEKVKIPIYRHEGKGPNEDCALYIVIKKILVSHWTKSNTPLHCLAHSCNPRYYSPSWIGAVPGRVAPNDDKEILDMRNKCLRKFFPDNDDYKTVKKEFADFSLMSNDFMDADSIEDREDFEPKQWWGTHGGSTKL